ncbi:MAG TPA: DUF4230 domain-containing protein [Micromonosporaceae bacterium]|nr:DUF4230 domain-containing protein [Micromonosporaceae bacterium]
MSDKGAVSESTSEFPEHPKPAAGSGGGRTALLLVGVIGLIAALCFGVKGVGFWPDWRNPFGEQRTDRSQPALLKSIQDLSRYVAAEGNFQVVIDLQRDRRYVPDFLLNQRTLFVGAGTVEAFVDFAQISEGAVTVTEAAEGKSVEIELPAPQLSKVRLDLAHSYVFAEERGLLNRLGEVFSGDPNRQQEVYLLAEERILTAARDSGLADRAQENTRKMLEGLLRSLGYEQVVITYSKL